MPLPFVSTLTSAARVIPGARWAERQAAGIERLVLGELQRRLDALRPPPPAPGLYAGAPRATNGSSPEPALSERLEALLRTSMHQTPNESRTRLYGHLLAELVPDEARILSALADGSSYPLVDILAGDRPVLENASAVGRAAGVAVPSLVPTYVGHLRSLGLVELGAEDAARGDEYQILLTDTAVLDAQAHARATSRRGARTVRRSVRMAPLGRELWAACDPSRGA